MKQRCVVFPHSLLFRLHSSLSPNRSAQTGDPLQATAIKSAEEADGDLRSTPSRTIRESDNVVGRRSAVADADKLNILGEGSFCFDLQTCLSKGRGFYTPSCHLMDFCDFRILVNCPMDLSGLSIFSPNLQRTVVESDDDHLERAESVEGVSRKRQKSEKPVGASDLIHAVPWYKFVGNLTLWNISSIDVVLISSPMAMLGLPFLTQMDGFCAKVYATEVTVELGEILMKDIVSMHTEFKQIYGPDESEFPDWMRWENLEKLPSKLEEIAAGELGVELNAWMPLYSAAHVKDCVKMIQSLKYAEETCYNGAINITAFSSGTEVGACNWRLNGQGTNLVYLSASVLASTHATEFNFQALRKCDLLLCSDLSSSSLDNDAARDSSVGSSVSSRKDNENQEASAQPLISADESREEMEKLSFICSVVIESVRSGGSVLIPIGRVGLILLLFEQISACLESSDVKVPMYFISSVAEELLAFTNIIPEWLCVRRSCEPLFGHTDLIKAKKLLLFPTIHSLDLLKMWEEPCVVFAPHWSLRFGPAVHLLQRWRADPNSLLITEVTLFCFALIVLILSRYVKCFAISRRDLTLTYLCYLSCRWR
uniref:Beta-Casp domain-containing protein n=1 Tax=Kalanchoe fedtschenkoi TaxID=63787 RepID=A0A7N0UT53_KALFE